MKKWRKGTTAENKQEERKETASATHLENKRVEQAEKKNKKKNKIYCYVRFYEKQETKKNIKKKRISPAYVTPLSRSAIFSSWWIIECLGISENCSLV